VGVGGLVLRGGDSEDARTQEVLVVRERRTEAVGVKYKLPGGLANAGEDFGAAAQREVGAHSNPMFSGTT
jgi:ADP-ribose pyrophosphatase YjhB (NUDIX family)